MAGGRTVPPARIIRFAPFELDVRATELRKHGIRIRLHQQPFRILLMLLERPGEVVLREEIRKALWPNNTVVEFDHSINAAIQRLRDALGDSASDPRYVETLARRGYRFLGEVEGEEDPEPHAPPEGSREARAASGDFTGTDLSHYRILDKLGEGGMGEVYRASDSKLGRDVAVKFLSPEFAHDPPWLARFEREAKVLASLSHPNIAAIYALEDRALVMELVVGQTLKGPVRLETALRYAEQIACALEAAHEKGVIHRDLKPANVMVKADGAIKVLDFGLAKSVEEATADPQNSPTLTSPTRAGMILGTAAYMSPEQAAGKPVDKRTDIWSFGVVLWELLTGRPLFAGETVTQILAAVLRGPIELDQLPKETPLAIREMLRRCLDRDSTNRLRDIGETRIAIHASLTGPATVEPAAATPAPLRRWLLGLLAAALPSVLALFLYFTRPAPLDLSRYKFTPIATDPEPETMGSWSPDGRSIAYVKGLAGAAQIMLRHLDSPMAVQLTKFPGGIQGNGSPVFSRDGERVYFISALGMWSVAVIGGDPVQVLPPDNIRAFTISPDGKTFAVWRGYEENGRTYSSVWISSPPGAPLRQYNPAPFRRDGVSVPNFLHFSPDGSQIAYAGYKKDQVGWIWSLPWPDSANAHPRQLFPAFPFTGGDRFSWLPDSQHLCFGDFGLWLGDARSGEVTRLTTAMDSYADQPAVSPQGDRILFTSIASDHDIVEVPLDGGPIRPLLATAREEMSPSWSAAGDLMAYVTERSGKSEIWLRSAEGNWDRPVVRQSDFPREPEIIFGAAALSPDGTRVAYTRHGRLWISRTSGGSPLPVAEVLGTLTVSWSPDGQSVAYTSSEGVTVLRIGSNQPLTLPGAEKCKSAPTWSPDGQWVACGEVPNSIVLVSPDGQKSRELTSPAMPSPQGYLLLWSRDGHTLYVASSDNSKSRLHAVDVKTGNPRLIAEYPEAHLFNMPYFRTSSGSLMPGGKSFATTVFHRRSDLWMLEGFPQPRRRWF